MRKIIHNTIGIIMAIRKYVSGENLSYALHLFEQKIKTLIDNITNVIQANETEIDELFSKYMNNK